jgi:hypothetical protein
MTQLTHPRERSRQLGLDAHQHTHPRDHVIHLRVQFYKWLACALNSMDKNESLLLTSSLMIRAGYLLIKTTLPQLLHPFRLRAGTALSVFPVEALHDA